MDRRVVKCWRRQDARGPPNGFHSCGPGVRPPRESQPTAEESEHRERGEGADRPDACRRPANVRDRGADRAAGSGSRGESHPVAPRMPENAGKARVGGRLAVSPARGRRVDVPLAVSANVPVLLKPARVLRLDRDLGDRDGHPAPDPRSYRWRSLTDDRVLGKLYERAQREKVPGRSRMGKGS